jgi:hypothetical protein
MLCSIWVVELIAFLSSAKTAFHEKKVECRVHHQDKRRPTITKSDHRALAKENDNMSSSEVKQALMKQVLTETSVANVRILIDVRVPKIGAPSLRDAVHPCSEAGNWN